MSFCCVKKSEEKQIALDVTIQLRQSCGQEVTLTIVANAVTPFVAKTVPGMPVLQRTVNSNSFST